MCCCCSGDPVAPPATAGAKLRSAFSSSALIFVASAYLRLVRTISQRSAGVSHAAVLRAADCCADNSPTRASASRGSVRRRQSRRGCCRGAASKCDRESPPCNLSRRPSMRGSVVAYHDLSIRSSADNAIPPRAITMIMKTKNRRPRDAKHKLRFTTIVRPPEADVQPPLLRQSAPPPPGFVSLSSFSCLLPLQVHLCGLRGG